MDKSFNDYVSIYKEQLEKGDIQVAYKRLFNYIMALKSAFEAQFAGEYTCGNVSPGYMDFTYFPFFDAFLRSEKLRFGIVLNHEKIRFELWLMGQNAEIQKRYWDLFKTSKWNENVLTMPKYSILETTLVAQPDFDDSDGLTAGILKSVGMLAGEITSHIKEIKE